MIVETMEEFERERHKIYTPAICIALKESEYGKLAMMCGHCANQGKLYEFIHLALKHDGIYVVITNEVGGDPR